MIQGTISKQKIALPEIDWVIKKPLIHESVEYELKLKPEMTYSDDFTGIYLGNLQSKETGNIVFRMRPYYFRAKQNQELSQAKTDKDSVKLVESNRISAETKRWIFIPLNLNPAIKKMIVQSLDELIHK